MWLNTEIVFTVKQICKAVQGKFRQTKSDKPQS